MAIQVGCCSRAFQQGCPSGDGTWLAQQPNQLRLMLADGLGHGPSAHAAVAQLRQRLEWIHRRGSEPLPLNRCLLELDQDLRSQGRGHQAAVALLDLQGDSGQLSALVVGNVQVHTLGRDGLRSVTSRNGMVGGNLPRNLQATDTVLGPNALILVHSDGVSSGDCRRLLEQLGSPARLQQLNAQVLSQRIVSRHGRWSDDASCAVVLNRDASQP